MLAETMRGARDAGTTRTRTAPAGGARKRGRGCRFAFAVLIFAAAGPGAPLTAGAGTVAMLDAPIALPSGIVADFQEFRIEERDGQGALVRFRFVADEIVEATAALEVLAADMDYLCDQVALPAITAEHADPARIVISIAAAPTEFGVSRPDIVQVFEAYRVDQGRCIWEAF
ncbi:DUF6497 family protein [Roseivivax sp. CAU 1753]